MKKILLFALIINLYTTTYSQVEMYEYFNANMSVKLYPDSVSSIDDTVYTKYGFSYMCDSGYVEKEYVVPHKTRFSKTINWNGSIVIGTEDEGVWIMENNKWVYFNSTNSDIDNEILSLYKGSVSGLLYIICREAVYTYNGLNLSPFSTTPLRAPINVLERKNGEVWLSDVVVDAQGEESPQINVYKNGQITDTYTRENCEAFQFVEEFEIDIQWFEPRKSESITCMTEDSEGNVWLSFPFVGVVRFDNQTSSWRAHFINITLDNSPYIVKDAFNFHIDSSGNTDNIWIAYSQGIILYKDGNITNYKMPTREYDILQKESGDLYIISTEKDGGFLPIYYNYFAKYNVDEDSWDAFELLPVDNRDIPHLGIVSNCFDNEGNLFRVGDIVWDNHKQAIQTIDIDKGRSYTSREWYDTYWESAPFYSTEYSLFTKPNENTLYYAYGYSYLVKYNYDKTPLYNYLHNLTPIGDHVDRKIGLYESSDRSIIYIYEDNYDKYHCFVIESNGQIYRHIIDVDHIQTTQSQVSFFEENGSVWFLSDNAFLEITDDTVQVKDIGTFITKEGFHYDGEGKLWYGCKKLNYETNEFEDVAEGWVFNRNNGDQWSFKNNISTFNSNEYIVHNWVDQIILTVFEGEDGYLYANTGYNMYQFKNDEWIERGNTRVFSFNEDISVDSNSTISFVYNTVRSSRFIKQNETTEVLMASTFPLHKATLNNKDVYFFSLIDSKADTGDRCGYYYIENDTIITTKLPDWNRYTSMFWTDSIQTYVWTSLTRAHYSFHENNPVYDTITEPDSIVRTAINITSSLPELYPIPAKEFLKIKYEGEYSIYSSSGFKIFNGAIANNGSIDVRELMPGIYFIEISSNGFSKIIPWIKE